MHRTLSLVAILCTLMSLLHLRAADRQPSVRVPCFVNAPELKLDGVPDEPFWQKAGKIGNFRRFHRYAVPAEAATTVRLALDRDNLYLALECDEPRGVALGKANGSAWSGDNVEIFLASLDRYDWYRQIVIGLNGGTYNEFIGENDYRKMIHVSPRRWTAEIIIPRNRLGEFSAHSLRFNMLRKRVNADETQTLCDINWAHEPDRFATLRIVPAAGEVTHGPWVSGISAGTAVVGWEQTGDGAGTLFLRRAGEKEFSRHSATGKPHGDGTATRHVFLRDLAPDTVYEYHTGDRNIRSFRTLDPKPADFSFGYVSDTHCRSKHLAEVLNWNPVRDTDLFFLLGDMITGVTGRGVCYDGFIDAMVRNRTKTTYCVRGNHEYRGNAPEAFFDLLDPQGRRSYFAFTHKGVFFLVLDTGDGMTETPTPYEAAQREWLRRTVASPEFAAAEFRVLLAHHPLRVMDQGGGMEIVRLYRAIPPEAAEKIDLMLSGHVHHYSRQLPQEAALYATHPAHNGMILEIRPPFPVLTCDFNGAILADKGTDRLRVTVLGKAGKVLDQLTIPRKIGGNGPAPMERKIGKVTE